MTRIEKMKEFFSTETRPVTNTELLEFKKNDPNGFEQVVHGIEDGTFTY